MSIAGDRNFSFLPWGKLDLRSRSERVPPNLQSHGLSDLLNKLFPLQRWFLCLYLGPGAKRSLQLLLDLQLVPRGFIRSLSHWLALTHAYHLVMFMCLTAISINLDQCLVF